MSSTTATFDVYPLSSYPQQEQDQKEHGAAFAQANVKVLHVVRHAEGFHNVNKEYRDEKNVDARLTENGTIQCAQLAELCLTSFNYHHHHHQTTTTTVAASLLQNTQLVVTSPLTRCVQTTLLSFHPILQNQETQKQHDIPLIAHEAIRETVNYACDRRRALSEIALEFPRVHDFCSLGEHDDHEDDDGIWNQYVHQLGTPDKYNQHRESAQLYRVAERARMFFQWLEQRPEQHVIVCSHAAFLRCLFNWGQDGGVPMAPEQSLDDRSPEQLDIPVVRYCGDNNNGDFERDMRRNYSNCEMRTFVMKFP